MNGAPGCANAFLHVDEAGTRLVSAGQYWISVGGGQPGTQAPTLDATFSITGARELPR